MSKDPFEKEMDAEVSGRVEDLLRKNALLRDELRQLREQSRALVDRIGIAQRSEDREFRRATLNLLEDTIRARASEQRENEVRRRVEDELRDANRRKDEFLAILAHELRGPLAPIRNSLHVLETVDVPEPVGRLHAIIGRQVDHMTRLVDDLLEVSRITRGQIELRREPVALANVVHTAIETARPLIESTRQTLHVEMPNEPIVLDVDPVRIAQVIANLLSNAAKYTDDGGTIWLDVVHEIDVVRIRVRDDGVGIPPAMLPRIFELFTQVDRTYDRARGGLGIGLTLVRELVEIHGGSIEARSEGPNRGSEFVVTLPVPAHAATSRQPDEEPAEAPSFESLPPRRVLVVDDNNDSAETLSMLLEALGEDVRACNDGETALEELRHYQPDVVLLDIGMPRMDGYEVARRARSMPECNGATLIALTGWGQEDDRRRSKEAGFDHHLVKPVNLDTLKTLLASL